MLRSQAQAGLIQLGRRRGGHCGRDVDGSRLARARPDSGSTAVLDHTTVLVENSQPDLAASDHLDGLLVVDEHRVVTGAVVGVEEVSAHFLRRSLVVVDVVLVRVVVLVSCTGDGGAGGSLGQRRRGDAGEALLSRTLALYVSVHARI